MSDELKKLKVRGQRAVRYAVGTGRLVRPLSCERCEKVGTVHAHHHDYSKSLEVEWLCRHCHAAEHRSIPTWVIAANELREQGHTYQQIADLLGKSYSAIFRRLNPDKATAYHRRDAKVRKEYKRENANALNRDEGRRGICVVCSGPMGIGNRADGTCRDCQKSSTAALGHAVEGWWAEGLTLDEIGDRLGKSKGWVGGMLDRWRGQGFDLPYRRRDGAKFGNQVPSRKAA